MFRRWLVERDLGVTRFLEDIDSVRIRVKET
jgi:hypothetical protein